MNTKLNRIKSALRESIEIANKATEGPWKRQSKYATHIISEYSNNVGLMVCDCPDSTHDASQFGPDCEFISHARAMTPLACKALLTAIEALEDIQSMGLECHGENALSSITSEWPDA